MLAVERSEYRAPQCVRAQPDVDVAECPAADGVASVLMIRRGRDKHGREVLGEVTEDRPIRSVIAGEDREPDVQIRNVTASGHAPKRYAKIERPQETEDDPPGIDHENARRGGSSTVHS